jgi:hypothetical protein
MSQVMAGRGDASTSNGTVAQGGDGEKHLALLVGHAEGLADADDDLFFFIRPHGGRGVVNSLIR